MPEGQLSVVYSTLCSTSCRTKSAVCWLIQALVNVGRNYNGPKVPGSSQEESGRTGTVIEVFETENTFSV